MASILLHGSAAISTEKYSNLSSLFKLYNHRNSYSRYPEYRADQTAIWPLYSGQVYFKPFVVDRTKTQMWDLIFSGEECHATDGTGSTDFSTKSVIYLPSPIGQSTVSLLCHCSKHCTKKQTLISQLL